MPALTPTSCFKRAFSLVELSIVLVILGLLIGGVLSGQSIIRAAQLRSVTNESSKYITAIASFKDKYFAMPGDMTNATSFWGIAGGTTGIDGACNTATSKTATCNGNGNGMIDAISSVNEGFRQWQHLALAGLIEGSYGYNATFIPGETLPASRISGAGWFLLWTGNASGIVSGSANAFDGNYGHAMNIFNRPTVTGILTAAEAWNIDTKVDDGIPYSGRVVSNYSATYSTAGIACTSATSGADFTATYNLANSSKDCGLFWRQL